MIDYIYLMFSLIMISVSIIVINAKKKDEYPNIRYWHCIFLLSMGVLMLFFVLMKLDYLKI